jgi:hypothetical protein
MSLSKVKYSFINCFQCVFSVLLSISFLLCNSPLKGLLQKADKEYSETTLSGKKLQLLTTDLLSQQALDESEISEDSDQGAEPSNLPAETPFFKSAQKVSLQIQRLQKSRALTNSPLPLYILYHNIKTLIEPDKNRPA